MFGLASLLAAVMLGVAACGDPATTTTASNTTVAEAVSESFADVWAASVAAVEGLSPVRVTIVATAQGSVLDDTAPEPDQGGEDVTQAEQLLDPARGRARLTVIRSGASETTVVTGRERITVSGGPDTVASYGRYVSLEPRAGLPLPLWARTFGGPAQGYDGLLGGLWEADAEEARPNLRVEQLEDGGRRLNWERSIQAWTAGGTLLLDHEFLPVRIETYRKGELPAGGELPEGTRAEYSQSLTYSFDKEVSFSSADFTLDPPADYWRLGVTYELSTERPWSEHADWGQYWLGARLDEWELVTAWHTSHEDNPDLGAGAEPADESIVLIYDRPGAPNDNESVQVTVRPLRGRVVEDSRAYAEQRMTAGDWVRQDMTVAGNAAVVYSRAFDGGPIDRIESMTVFLPNALVELSLWAAVDPREILNAVRPVD